MNEKFIQIAVVDCLSDTEHGSSYSAFDVLYGLTSEGRIFYRTMEKKGIWIEIELPIFENKILGGDKKY